MLGAPTFNLERVCEQEKGLLEARPKAARADFTLAQELDATARSGQQPRGIALGGVVPRAMQPSDWRAVGLKEQEHIVLTASPRLLL